MKKLFPGILAILLANIMPVSAQYVHLKGYVTDAQSGEKLLGANVCEKHTQTCTVSNEYGYFDLIVPEKDTLTLWVSFTGYKNFQKSFTDKIPSVLHVSLEPGESLGEVEVTVKTNRIERKTEMSRVQLKPAQIIEMPVILSEPDLIKAMQKLPGVLAGSELFGGMYVRGGSNDQNLYLLDDVPLYYINHLGGFLSVFNAYSVKRADLYKGDFPARYGGRLSSVLDVRTRDGNKFERHGEFSIGALTWKLSLEGPVKKGKTSYFVSGRRFMYDLILRALERLAGEGSGGYTFYDFNAKINHVLDPKNQLYFSWYYGDDAFSMQFKEGDAVNKFRTGWGNHLMSLRWNHIFRSGFFLNTTAYFTRYRFEVKDKMTSDTDELSYRYFSGIKDFSLKTDATWHISSRDKLKFGTGYIYHIFSPGASKFKVKQNGSQTDTLIGNLNLFSSDVYAYAQWKHKWSGRLTSRLGIRSANYIVNNRIFNDIEPRISLNFLVNKHFSIKTSYARMQQPVHLLSTSNLDLPIDLWMPSTTKLPPSKGWITAVGAAWSNKDNSWDVSSEIYYKELTGIPFYKPGTFFLQTSLKNWENLLYHNGLNRSYGWEWLIRKTKGKWTGWLAYTLSRSTLRFPELNHGRPFPFKYDRTHSIDIVLRYKPSERFIMSMAWNFGSGLPVTLPVGEYQLPVFTENNEFYTIPVNIYTERNGYRMHPYHRLDISLMFPRKLKHGELIWTIGVYNAYNRQNPFMYQVLDYNPRTGNYDPGVYQFSLFPMIPSVSFTYRF